MFGLFSNPAPRDITTPAQNDRRSTLATINPSAASLRLPGFRQMFLMDDGSIFSAMVNPPNCIMEWHTQGQWFWGLVDTGATYMHLMRAEATRMGFDLRRLRYDQAVSTGGGIVYKDVVEIPEMKIGPLCIRNVKATVSQKDFHDDNLVGKSFLLSVPGGSRLIEEGLLLYPGRR